MSTIDVIGVYYFKAERSAKTAGSLHYEGNRVFLISIKSKCAAYEKFSIHDEDIGLEFICFCIRADTMRYLKGVSVS